MITGSTPAAAPARKASGTVRYLLRAGSPDETKSTQDFLDKNFTPQSGVKVTVEPTDAMADEKLTAAMVGGTAQDVFDTWLDNVTQFADKGQVLDLDPLVARDLKDADVKDFFGWQWKDFKLPSGIRFGMPKYVNFAVVYYNLDLFDKAGLGRIDDSWDHVKYADAARKLTQNGTVGLFFQASSIGRWWYKLNAWGGNLVDPADNTHATFDSDESLAALEWSRKLIFDDKAMGNQADLVGVGQRAFDAIPAAFGAGKIAMVEDGFYPFVQAKAINKKFRWAYAAVPKGPKGRKVFGTADGFAIWKGSKNQDAAWELVKYLSGKEYQLYLTQTHRVPASPHLGDCRLEKGLHGQVPGTGGREPGCGAPGDGSGIPVQPDVVQKGCGVRADRHARAGKGLSHRWRPRDVLQGHRHSGHHKDA